MLYNIVQLAAPANPLARPKMRFITIRCDDINDRDLREYSLVRYGNLTDANADTNRQYTERLPKPVHHDSEELTIGNTYYFRWFWTDIYDNKSALSSVVNATFKRTQTIDVDDNAVLPSKVKSGNHNSLVRDGAVIDLSLWGSTGPGALTLNALGAANITESENYLYKPASASDLAIQTITADIPVKAGKKYYAAATIGGSGGTYSVYVNWCTYDSSTGAVAFISTDLVGQFTAAAAIELEAIVTAPATAKRAQIVAAKSGGTNTDLVFYGPLFRKAASTDQIPTGAITDTKTDPTAPTAPGTVVLAQVQKRDKDGPIKTHVKVSLASIAGYSAKTTFYFLVTDNLGNPAFTVHGGKDATGRFPAEVGTTYNVVAYAKSFNGVSSAASGSVGITPVKKAATDIPTPAGLAVAVGIKSNAINWTAVDTGTYPDFEQTFIYLGGSTPTPGVTAPWRKTKSNAIDHLHIATAQTYWIAHKDASDNFTAVTGPISGTPLLIATADFQIGAVDSAALGSNSVLPSKVKSGNHNSLVRDGAVVDLSMWGSSGPGALTLNALDATNITESENYLYKPPSTSDLTIQTITADIPVKAGKKYYAAATIGGSGGTYSLYVNWLTYDSSTGAVAFISTDLVGQFTAAAAIELESIVTAPATAKRAQIVAAKSGGTNTDLAFYGPLFRKAASTDQIPTGAITAAKVDQTTTLAAPSGLTLDATNKQVDQGDGTVKTWIKASWTAVTGATSYVLEINDGVQTIYLPAKKSPHRFEATVGTGYTVKVASATVFGVESSAYSSGVTSTPTLISGAPAAPTGFSITPGSSDLGSKGVYLSLAVISTFAADYLGTVIQFGYSSSPLAAITIGMFDARYGIVRIPWLPTSGNLYIWAYNVNNSRIASATYPASTGYTIPGVQISASMIEDAAVPAKMATAAAGDLGSYSMLKNVSASAMFQDSINPAANLVYSDSLASGSTAPPAGSTWKCMSRCSAGAASLFLRVT